MKHIYGLFLVLLLCAAPSSLAALDPDEAQKPPLQTEDITQTQERQLPSPAPLMLPTLSDPADPSGFFFAAEQMRTRTKDSGLTPDQQQLAEYMYSLAFRFAKNPAAQEAGKSLFSLLSDEGRPAEAAVTAREWIQSFGPDWSMYRNLYDALMAQGSFPAALSLVSELSSALPGVAKSRSTELSWMEYNARSAMHDFGWTLNGLPFIKTKTPDAYIAKIYRLYAAAPNIPQNTAALALFRAAATERKYAEALANALPILPTFSMPDTPRAWVSELGRSFYGAGAWQQGLDFFSTALGLEIRSPEVLHNLMPDSTDAATSDASTEAAAAAQEPVAAPPALDRARIPSELSWVMAFHLARMYQGTGDSQTAASIFIELVPLAFSGEDSDSALWYWLDITMDSIAATDSLLSDLGQDEANAIHAKRALEISALSQAASLWKSPSYFEDIVADYMRRLLREGAWDDVVRLCALMSQKLTAAMRGPLLYLSGRLFETGRANIELSSDSDFWKWLAPFPQTSLTGASADAPNGNRGGAAGPQDATPNVSQSVFRNAPLFYQALLRENGIEEHYRTLAAWRLGIDPPVLANAPVLDRNFDIIAAISSLYPDTKAPPVSDDKLKDMLDFIGQSLNYGLETLAADQVAALSPFSTDALLWLAMKFTQHEQYYPALRIGREALNRKSATRPELGYALLYPRAWPEHFSALTAPRNIAEPLAYAIVRSESLFNQRAVSRSGAMGLSQLLPSTAAETARGLKMSQYALFNPQDNLTIGLTYYGYMLQRFENRPVRAIAAYNAGPSRMAQWARDWGGLDDDILIELYPLAEPRQYTKNITSAALFYGKLYYGISAKDMLDFLYGVKPLPQQAVPAGVTGQTVTATTPESSSSGTADGAPSSSATTGTAGGAPAVIQGPTAGTATPASATPSETSVPAPDTASPAPQQTAPQPSSGTPTQSSDSSSQNISP
jgi:soluble lytic murein transglycosylase-like protein